MVEEKKRRIGELWSEYRRQVVAAGAGPLQVEETRRAFYAGAATLFGALMNVLGPESEPTETEFQALDEIALEFREHLDDLRKSIETAQEARR